MMVKFKLKSALLLTGIFLLNSTVFTSAQLISKDRWTDYFSYANISHIKEINGFIFCSAENGLFSYDPNSQEIVKNSKVDELNDVGITSFNYSEEKELILVGFESGEMDMLGPEDNYNLLEIPLHQAYTGSKRVNHIFPYENSAIISGEFGLASFSLDDFEFMETCYFIQQSAYFGVKESAVLDGVIYAASDKGIFMHPLNEFIANFTVWQQPTGVPQTAFQHIVVFQNNLFAASNGSVYRFDGNNWMTFGNFNNLRDISVNGNVMSITQLNSVTNFNENFSQIETLNFTDVLNTGLKVGTTTYGGSIIKGMLNGNNQILPDGPYNNQSWSLTTIQDQIWIAPGGMSNFNEPLQNPSGFYHFNGTKWIHHTTDEMLNAKDVVDIEVNPTDTTEIYISTWFEHPSWNESGTHIGMFQFKNGQMSAHYNSQNSGLKFRERIGGSVMDEEGNLWVSQTAADPGNKSFIHKKSPSGNWVSRDLNAAEGNAGSRKPFIYNGYAFVPLPRQNSGLKITNMQEVYTINAYPETGNLPSSEVISAAIDKNGVLWIGTLMGLRILYNPIEAVQSGSFQAQPIVIEQNGIPEALLTDVQINDIKVDGANQKWVATETGGVYYFSEDGTQTVYHFTKANSPLPSNKVNNISVEKTTGEVFFATDRGVVSFRSDAVESGESFGDVYAYPNPVRPGFKGEVTIKGLPIDADVRIVDVVGNLIYQAKSAGGVVKWDTTNMNGKPVASGIYLVLMTNRDASENKQTKIAIVR